MATILVETIGGNCPVQAEGTVNGNPFYFRARGQAWSLCIGGEDVVAQPEWFWRQSYGTEPFEAGWMTEDEARGFIQAAAERWAAGAPSMQAWRLA